MGKASENGSNIKTWMMWNSLSNGMRNIWQLENFQHLILRTKQKMYQRHFHLKDWSMDYHHIDIHFHQQDVEYTI